MLCNRPKQCARYEDIGTQKSTENIPLSANRGGTQACKKPHSPTTGPSATLTDNPSSSFKPSHFRVRFFFAPAARRLSPPVPIHILPSAVPAAMMPDEEIAVDMMNGGVSDMPDSGGGVAV